MPALKWLRLLMNHIPDQYEHLVRYYGYYSNRSRGVRRLATADHDPAVITIVDDSPVDRRRKASLAANSCRGDLSSAGYPLFQTPHQDSAPTVQSRGLADTIEFPILRNLRASVLSMFRFIRRGAHIRPNRGAWPSYVRLTG